MNVAGRNHRVEAEAHHRALLPAPRPRQARRRHGIEQTYQRARPSDTTAGKRPPRDGARERTGGSPQPARVSTRQHRHIRVEARGRGPQQSRDRSADSQPRHRHRAIALAARPRFDGHVVVHPPHDPRQRAADGPVPCAVRARRVPSRAESRRDRHGNVHARRQHPRRQRSAYEKSARPRSVVQNHQPAPAAIPAPVPEQRTDVLPLLTRERRTKPVLVTRPPPVATASEHERRRRSETVQRTSCRGAVNGPAAGPIDTEPEVRPVEQARPPRQQPLQAATGHRAGQRCTGSIATAGTARRHGSDPRGARSAP